MLLFLFFLGILNLEARYSLVFKVSARFLVIRFPSHCLHGSDFRLQLMF